MNVKKFKNQKFTTGFTLIELMVSTALFSIIVGVIGGIFLTSLQNQRKAIAFQGIFDQTSYLMEYMSRSLRMAKKDLSGTCVLTGTSYQQIDHGIKFLDSQNVCREFYLETNTNRIREHKAGELQDQYLTSEDSQVTAFNISVSNGTILDPLQPKATFFIAIEGKGSKSESISSMEFQTTVSQRRFNIE